MNNLLGRDSRRELPDEFILDNSPVSDPLKIANEFNRYFTGIGSSLAEKFMSSDEYKNYLIDNIGTVFSFETVSVEDMKKVVLSFKDSSPGHDDVPMRIIKRNIDVLAEVLVYICNLSLCLVIGTGIFPKALMVAVITCLQIWKGKLF